MGRRTLSVAAAACLAAMMAFSSPTKAYIEVPYSLGRLVFESTNIVLMQVEKIDNEKNLIIYKKLEDLKGKHPTDVIKHNIGRKGFNPREWQTIMAWAQVGKVAVMCYNQTASETCIENYWYQCYPGDWWSMYHAEPYLLRSFCGKPEKLASAVREIVAGKEAVVTAMVDGDKNALQLQQGRIQRLRASLKLMDYNAARDFVGWGAEEFRRIATMPGFSHLGQIGRIDGDTWGIAPCDFNNDGQGDLCLYSDQRVLLLQSAGLMMEETPLPWKAGARGVAWGDWNTDGRPDLLIASTTGPVLLTNLPSGFRDDTKLLPGEAYYNVTAVAWIDADANGRPDVLLANGFLGLRLYRNLTTANSAEPRDQSHAFQDTSDSIGLGLNGATGKAKGDRIVVADLNRDGRQDFIYCAAPHSVVAMNTPKGFVETLGAVPHFQSGRIAPVLADVNADDAPDLLVPQSGSLKLFTNNGHGQFADATPGSGDLAKFSAIATSIVAADPVSPGRMDLFIGCVGGINRALRNNRDGTFTDITREIGFNKQMFNTRGICAADINHDGTADLALINQAHESIVLIGAGSLPQKR